MMNKYILDENGQPVLCEDVLEWGKWMEDKTSRRVALTIVNGVKISTVFLGLDHGWPGPDFDPLTYKPVLWETMIFGGKYDESQFRYTSLENARIGHGIAVKSVEEDIDPESIPWSSLGIFE